MAHTPADGPLGLEGRVQFKSGDQFPPGTEADVFMYGKHRPDLGNAWIKVDRIIGLHGLGEADDFRDAAEGREGEIVYPSAQRGKSIVYEGRVCGVSLLEMRALAADLRRVGAESRARRTGSITIVDPASTGTGYATGVRCMALDMDDEQRFGPRRQPTLWQRSFVLGLRAHDPRFVWYPVEESLGNDESDIVALDNDGYAPADLKFDIFSTNSPMDVTIQNNTTGKVLIFENLPIFTDDLLHIDWSQRAAVSVDGDDLPAYTPNVDMMPYFDTSASDWWNAMEWGLGPGANDIQVIGSNIDHWDVYWQHTSY